MFIGVEERKCGGDNDGRLGRLVEREVPDEYMWGGYVELLEMAKKHG